MPYIYSNPADESNPHKIPNVQILEFTAEELALADDDIIFQYARRPEFKLASMKRSVMDQMVEAIIEEEGIKGGWCFQFCLPGCLPDSSPFGPYETYEAAVNAAREFCEEC